MKKLSLALLFVSGLAGAVQYCPSQVTCSGNTIDTCSTDVSGVLDKVYQLGRVFPGVYKLQSVNNSYQFLMPSNWSAQTYCQYVLQFAPNVKSYVTVGRQDMAGSMDIDVKNQNWKVDGINSVCYPTQSPKDCPILEPTQNDRGSTRPS
jgi:hypothetical protein